MFTYSRLKSVADSVSQIARALGLAFVTAALVACYIAAYLIDSPESGYDEADFAWLDASVDDDAEVNDE